MIRNLTTLHYACRQFESIHLYCPCTSRRITTSVLPSSLSRVDTDSPGASSREKSGKTGNLPSSRSHRKIGRLAPTIRPYRHNAEVTLEHEHSRLPRYLRRAAATTPASSPPQFNAVSSRQPLKGVVSSRNEPVFRSRHYDASEHEKSESEIRLLQPHVLSARIKKLCNASQVDAAVSLLKNSPLDAQNTPVWNTLIWECMKAKRFKLAYQLLVDMKRRGFSPTIRTFQTMFTGLSRIENWSTHSKQLTNTRLVYEGFQRYISAVRQNDAHSPELSINPLAAYIKILGDAGQYQEIFDVYYTMDPEGPLAPNQFIFTAMFQALSTRHDTSGSRTSTISSKNAADARLLWTQMLKASKITPGFQVDSILVSSTIMALSRGRPVDQDYAFQIVREYYGLTAPEEPPATGIIPLAAQSLAAIFTLCNNSKKQSLCLHFFHQVKRRPEALGGKSILDRAHLEDVLKAHLSLSATDMAERCLEKLEWMLRQEILGQNGPKIRPTISTFNLVLMACWRGADWNSAMRTFDLMTGYHSHDFMDGAVSDAPRLVKRSAGRNLIATAETMSCVVQAALASSSHANMRQCLRIVDHLDAERLLMKPAKTGKSNETVKKQMFYVSKLASALVDTIYHILNNSGNEHSSRREMERWRDIATQAGEVLKGAIESEFIPTTYRDSPSRALN